MAANEVDPEALRRWSPADDAKVLGLFGKPPSRGGVSAKDTSHKAIESVRLAYWPKKNYRSFAQLYRRKATKWIIEQAKKGARAGECSFVIAQPLCYSLLINFLASLMNFSGASYFGRRL